MDLNGRKSGASLFGPIKYLSQTKLKYLGIVLCVITECCRILQSQLGFSLVSIIPLRCKNCLSKPFESRLLTFKILHKNTCITQERLEFWFECPIPPRQASNYPSPGHGRQSNARGVKLNVSLSEPEFPYIEALVLYQPLAMKVSLLTMVNVIIQINERIN